MYELARIAGGDRPGESMLRPGTTYYCQAVNNKTVKGDAYGL